MRKGKRVSPDEPVFDLVAVAYKAAEESRRFIQSLEILELPFTLTLVDNDLGQSPVHSLLPEWTEKVGHLPNCVESRLVVMDENVGYARACNRGAKDGRAPFLGLLNMDTRFVNYQCLTKIRHAFDEDERVGIVGPRTTDSTGRLTHAGILRSDDGRDKHRFWLRRDQGQANDWLDVPTVSGATYFVRRATWDELTECPTYQEYAEAEGAFLPTRHFYEETFCSYHARAHDWRVVYAGGAHMIHEWHRSSSPKESSSHWADSKRMFEEALTAHGIEVPR